MTTLFSIIGYPLSHALSPVIHNAAYEAMGLDARYEGWNTPPEEVGAAIERMRANDDHLGMNVTVPHKQAVMQHLDVLQRSGLVHTEKVGRVRTCRLVPEPMRTLEQWIAEHRATWERHFDRLADVLDHAFPPDPGESR